MSLYARLALTAQRMITQFGQLWTITATTGANASTARTVQGVVVGQVKHVLGDSGVEIGDKEMMLEATANPVQGERIAAGSESYIVMQVEPIRPAAVTLAWRVWARSG